MDFKQRLSDLLVQNNHSQAELARFVGVKNNTVNDWINKGTSPKIENLYRIAEFFDISIVINRLHTVSMNGKAKVRLAGFRAVGNINGIPFIGIQHITGSC